MFFKIFKFTKKRVAKFIVLLLFIFLLQYLLTGSMVSKQKVTTEAGNNSSSVIGILDDAEVIRQKFSFDRNVQLSAFIMSFGSFNVDEVGQTLNVELYDGNDNQLFKTTIPVNSLKQNSTRTMKLDEKITVPRGVTCCIRVTCSSPGKRYDKIPTINTTNRTNPNTYLSTLKMQTHKKSLNVAYTYTFRQIYPLIVLILEIFAIFVLCFEQLTEDRKRFLKEFQKAHKQKAKKQKAGKTAVTIADQTKLKKRVVFLMKCKKIVKWCLGNPKVFSVLRVVVLVLNPLFTALFIEVMNGTSGGIYPNVWIFTWIFLGAIELLVIGLFGNKGIPIVVMDCILFALGLANLFIMNVRGTPFLPADFFGVATATEVVDHYKLSLTPAQFIGLPAFFIWCLILLRIKKRKYKMKAWKIVVKKGVPVVAGVACVAVLYSTSLLEICGVQDNVWNKVQSCQKNGFYLNYFINLHYLAVSKPAGYSEDDVKKIVAQTEKQMPGADVTPTQSLSTAKVKTNADFGTNTTLNGKKPNIILIMNESLADFTKEGTVDFTKDPLPFIHSLKDNTISGKDYVSIFGAGTSNSEFEAMTGNTMTFFPSGCNVYQQFMHDSTYSLPSYLKTLGYTCQAVHPSSGGNWNRINTYKSMKFDHFTTIKEFKNPEYIRYISDKESYKKVIELYEKKKEGQPFFAFDMTIQNHGGYLTNTAWKNPVSVKGSYYPETKEYLSSIRVSDDAFKYLIDYFKKQDEPTLIFMFGDHLPSVEEEFYEKLLGKNQSEWDLQDIQKRFWTPFVLWANYDIEGAEDVVISNNYVMNMILKQAGIELPLYNKFIEKVSDSIPAMNVNGYMDESGKWHYYGNDESSTVSSIIKNYKLTQYAYYSDNNKDETSKIFKMKK